jgi:5-methylcytosine-specific restriction endonuclease McrA
MSISNEIKRTHILRAIRELKKSGKKAIPRRRMSTKYDVSFEGGKYPPKYLISYAHKFVDGHEWPNIFSGGAETNNFLIARKFDVFNKQTRKKVGLEAVEENDESAFPEGRQRYRMHRQRERDSRIARLAKRRRLSETGDLACDVCGFSFAKSYGEIGIGFIEAHHTIPVSQLSGRRKTKLAEIALVCSNCHRMLHRARPWLSVLKLKKL